MCIRDRGNSAGAEREFRVALENNPRFAEAYFNLGLVLAAQQRWGEAKESLRAAIDLNPANARAWWILGRVLRDIGDLKAARDYYAKAWRLDHGLTEAALEYGKLLPARDARELWQAALEL